MFLFNCKAILNSAELFIPNIQIYMVIFFSDIKCLKSVMESGTQSLSPKCKAKLQERLVMYKSAAQVSTLIICFLPFSYSLNFTNTYL